MHKCLSCYVCMWWSKGQSQVQQCIIRYPWDSFNALFRRHCHVGNFILCEGAHRKYSLYWMFQCEFILCCSVAWDQELDSQRGSKGIHPSALIVRHTWYWCWTQVVGNGIIGMNASASRNGFGACQAPVSEASYFPIGLPPSPASLTKEAGPLHPRAEGMTRKLNFGPREPQLWWRHAGGGVCVCAFDRWRFLSHLARYGGSIIPSNEEGGGLGGRKAYFI